MPIAVQCPSCGQKLQAPDHLAGKQVRCGKCREPMTVRARASASAPRMVPTSLAECAKRHSKFDSSEEPAATKRPPSSKRPSSRPWIAVLERKTSDRRSPAASARTTWGLIMGALALRWSASARSSFCSTATAEPTVTAKTKVDRREKPQEKPRETLPHESSGQRRIVPARAACVDAPNPVPADPDPIPVTPTPTPMPPPPVQPMPAWRASRAADRSRIRRAPSHQQRKLSTEDEALATADDKTLVTMGVERADALGNRRAGK